MQAGPVTSFFRDQTAINLTNVLRIALLSRREKDSKGNNGLRLILRNNEPEMSCDSLLVVNFDFSSSSNC